jgi:hypothetical protein
LPNAKKSKIEPQGKKPEFGLHVKRLFYSTKAFGFNDLASKEQLELETPRNCYVCKQNLLKCIIFMTVCVPIVVILIMQSVSKPPM